MSNEINFNLNLPMDTPEVSNFGMMKSGLDKSASADLKMNSVWEQPSKTEPTASQPARNKKTIFFCCSKITLRLANSNESGIKSKTKQV